MESAGEAHKARGNELLKAGSFAEAAEAYGEAIKADASVVAYWSNRSHAVLRSGDAPGALSDADEAVRLKPDWAKAHWRRAQALKELGRPLDAAKACDTSLALATADAEKKEIRKLREVMTSAAAAVALSGWWHGQVSKELGGFMQEFCFLADGELRCCVYGQELTGTYDLRDVEVLLGGELKGGADVRLSGERVPYLFRQKGDDILDLCCPMTSPPERPRTFHGPGHVAMRKGRHVGDDSLAALPEGRRVLRYLEELTEAVDAQMADAGSGNDAVADQTAERLMEAAEDGGTLTSQKIMGPESLEDKAKKMAHDHHVQALRLKYTDAIDDIAQQLLKGDLDAGSAYPEEAKDLERAIRRMKRCAPAPEPVGDEAEEAAEAPGQAPEAIKPSAEVAAAPVAQAPPMPEASKPVVNKVAAPPLQGATPPLAGGCCGGCFAAFKR